MFAALFILSTLLLATIALKQARQLRQLRQRLHVLPQPPAGSDSEARRKQMSEQIQSAIQKTDSIISAASRQLNQFDEQARSNRDLIASFTKLIDDNTSAMQQLAMGLGSLNQKAASLHQMQEMIAELTAQIQEVTAKTNQIGEIATQAQLVSFNATLEAARAGSYGKGFMVVAEEVGKLANRSQSLANNIMDTNQKTDKELAAFHHDMQELTLGLRDSMTELQQQGQTADQLSQSLQGSLTSFRSQASDFQLSVKEFSEELRSGLESLTGQLNNAIIELSDQSLIDLSVHEAEARLAEFFIIDVRRDNEFEGELGHLPGAKLCTLGEQLDRALESFDKEKPYLFVCRSGGRSLKAARLAIQQGFQKVYNLQGGMLAWQEAKRSISKPATRSAA